jgi:hypothetical protein
MMRRTPMAHPDETKLKGAITLIDQAIEQLNLTGYYLCRHVAVADLRRVRNELDAELEAVVGGWQTGRVL